MASRDCAILIGPHTVSIRFEGAGDRYIESVRDYYAVSLSPYPPDVSLEIEVADGGPKEAVPDNLLAGKRMEGLRFTMHGDLVEGEVSEDGSLVRIRAQARLFGGHAVRIFEQILYQIYYDLVARRGSGCRFLLHAAAVATGDGGAIFTGPSTAGKSTAAELSLPRLVLNDEIVEVIGRGSEYWVASTPFNGFFRRKRAASCHLGGIFVLEKGTEHRVERLTPAVVAGALLSEIAPPVGIREAFGARHALARAELAAGLAETVPGYRLVFRKDAGFWDVVGEVLAGAGGR
ncbi:MAG: hypothetical protein JXP34_18785 [Planctomycetes bacterium]|nr:hypothetical protein [Planctomycetota bacterium]